MAKKTATGTAARARPDVGLNGKAAGWARNRIKAGYYVAGGRWDFSAADGDALLGDPPDWTRYANYFLGLDRNAEPETKGRFKYPFAKKVDGAPKVYRAGLVAIRSRAAQQEQTDIFEASGSLIALIDEKEGRGAPEGLRRAYTGPLDQRLDSPLAAGAARFDVADVELRAEQDDDGTRLVGYAARFDVDSVDMVWGRERIRKGAFAKSLKRGDDVIANLEHEGGTNVLGRRSNGTLSLAEDDKGLRVEISPPDTQVGRDVVELVRRRDLTQMSFAFRVVRQELDDADDVTIRTLLEVDLFDVSIVARPAYPQTVVELKADAGVEELERRLEHMERETRLLELAAIN